jgi:hypothetical protein
VVDDAQGIVTALKTGIMNEAHELMGLIDQHQINAGVAAKTIIAGYKYGTVENYIETPPDNRHRPHGRFPWASAR